MANTPKDSPLSSADTCALYYFPEIPSHGPKNDASGTLCSAFVGEAVQATRDDDHEDAQPEDSEQVRALIDEAFADGAAQGRAETMAAQQARVDKAVGALQAAVEEMARQRRHDIRRMETETVRLALAIAKKIIGTAADQGETIAHVVKAAMEKVADPRQLLLRLNPADIEAVDAFKQELLMDGDVGAVMRLEADDTIERGGCVIETGRGDIDARIEQQIKVIEALLEDQLPPLPADA